MQAAVNQPTHLVNVNQVFFWSSDTHSHVVTCREKTQYSIRQTRTLLHVHQAHKHHRGCCCGAQGPSTEQQTKTRSDHDCPLLGVSCIKSCLLPSTDLKAQNQSVIAPTGVSSIITDLCVDLKYKLFTYLNCSNLF